MHCIIYKVIKKYRTIYTDEIWKRNSDNLKFWIKDQILFDKVVRVSVYILA